MNLENKTSTKEIIIDVTKHLADLALVPTSVLRATRQLDKEKTFLSNSNFMRVYLYTGAIGIEALRFAGFYCVYKAMRGEIQ